MTIPDPPFDVTSVAAWMDGEGLGSGPLERLEPLAGGTQNVMVSFERDGRRYILRRGPRHLRAGSNAIMGREITLLGALARTDVPHAQLIASCADESVLGGAVFYLMEPIDGYNALVTMPADQAADPEARHRMGLSMVEALATLGSVDPWAVGLDGFGRPDGFLERQVPRWSRELDSYAELDGYPGPDIGDVPRIAQWLESNRPTTWTPGILHGDFHISNVMFRPDAPEIAAIVDWEMTTIGDPLLDLGWMLSLWPAPGERQDLLGSVYADGPGVPTEEEIVARYAERSDRDVSHIDWYVVLACFKLGIVLEGTYARSLAGLAPVETGLRLHETTLRLFERAITRIEEAA
jgi:aminoglycoside phosphotransferase (APT) family kinase protein